jgi:GT2 family glycosyltransferase
MGDRRIATVIVTYNAEQFIEKCINSLHLSSIRTDVTVVDNNSSDKTCEMISAKFPQVKLIQSSSNLGFGKANNIGIRWALSNQADFVFLLNQDAWIEENALQALLSISDAYSQYGILSPIHYQYENDTWHKGFYRYIKMYAPLLLNEAEIQTDALNVYDVEFVPAALWFVRAETFRKVGGFDPIYFMYGEDNDLASRVQAAGYKIGVVPEAKGHHLEKEYAEEVPIARLSANYFRNFVSVLKYSPYHWLRRYIGFFYSAILQVFTAIRQGDVKKVKAILLACFSIVQLSNQLEISRRKIAQSEGAFLEISDSSSD